MPNHPNRGWRRRAHQAAVAYVAQRPSPADAVAVALTPEQLAALMHDAYIAGYGDGRKDANGPATD